MKQTFGATQLWAAVQHSQQQQRRSRRGEILFGLHLASNNVVSASGIIMSSPSSNNDEQGLAAILFSSNLTRHLSATERLPGTHVGVRRVRPSTRAVKEAMRKQLSSVHEQTSNDDNDAGVDTSSGAAIPSAMEKLHPSNVCFTKIGEDGKERRMTKQEKKALKLELRKQRADMYKELKKQQQPPASDVVVATAATMLESTSCSNHTGGVIADVGNAMNYGPGPDVLAQNSQSDGTSIAAATNNIASCGGNYHTLNVSRAAIQEELDELRGTSNRIPPVVLSAPMVNEALRSAALCVDKGTVSCNNSKDQEKNQSLKIDDDCGRIWAGVIQEAMAVAEDVRSDEDMRPMAYKIVPEVWQRLRPEGLKSSKACNFSQKPEGNLARDVESSQPSEEEKRRWSFIRSRPSLTVFDKEISTVFSLLYRLTQLHMSCGAKFGCDLLLYDGNREERHAFAGIRICHCTSEGEPSPYTCTRAVDSDGSEILLPLPNPYDLSGFVRCLNTAGKLALLATVVHGKEGGNDSMTTRVAIVDLALEKVLSAPTHRKKRSSKRKQVRKTGGEHLDKKRG